MSSTVAGLSTAPMPASPASGRTLSAARSSSIPPNRTRSCRWAWIPRPDRGSRFIRYRGAKTVKNRLHMDLITNDFDVESARLIGLGARKVRDVEASGGRWTTFADVEGNEFDLIAG